MPLSSDELRHRLCALGAHVRGLVTNAHGVDMAAVTGSTAADVIYGIDRVADDALLGWFEQHWRGVRVVSEGLDEPVDIGNTPEWTVIVDTIDGTRGLMYDKRSAWCLAAAAPCGGSLADLSAAAMTELPTSKMSMADQLSGHRGGGLHAERSNLLDGSTVPLAGPSFVRHGPRAQLQRPGQVLRAWEGEVGGARSGALPTSGMSTGLRRRVSLERWPAARADDRARPFRGRPAAADRGGPVRRSPLRRLHLTSCSRRPVAS